MDPRCANLLLFQRVLLRVNFTSQTGDIQDVSARIVGEKVTYWRRWGVVRPPPPPTRLSYGPGTNGQLTEFTSDLGRYD